MGRGSTFGGHRAQFFAGQPRTNSKPKRDLVPAKRIARLRGLRRAGCPLLAAEPRAKLRSAETCPAAQAGIISLGNTRKRCDQTRENVQPNLTNDERTERTDGLGRCRSPKNSTREVVTSALSSRRPKILLQAFICREAHAVRMLHCCYCPAATDAVDNNNSLLPHTASTTSASTTAVVAAATHSFFSRRRRTGFVRDRSGGWHDPA